MTTQQKGQNTFKSDLNLAELPAAEADEKLADLQKPGKLKSARKNEKSTGDSLDPNLDKGKKTDPRIRRTTEPYDLNSDKHGKNTLPLNNLKTPSSDSAKFQIKPLIVNDLTAPKTKNNIADIISQPNHKQNIPLSNPVSKSVTTEQAQNFLWKREPETTKRAIHTTPQIKTKETLIEKPSSANFNIAPFFDRILANFNNRQEIPKSKAIESQPVILKTKEPIPAITKESPAQVLIKESAGSFSPLKKIIQSFKSAISKETPETKIIISKAPLKQIIPAAISRMQHAFQKLVIQTKPELIPQKIAATPVVSPPIKLESSLKQMQRVLYHSIKNNFPSTATFPQAKVKAILINSQELKSLAVKIDRQYPVLPQTIKNQLQRTIQETFRISANQYPNYNSPQQINKIVSNTVSKLETVYGHPVVDKFKGYVVSATTETVRPSSKNDQKEPSNQPPFVPSFTPNYPGNPPPAPIGNFAKDRSSKNVPEEEPDLPKEEEELETKNPLADEPDLRGIQKKIKEDRHLIIQKVYTLSGQITLNGKQSALSGVIVDGGDLGVATTNFAGEFSFYNVPEGKVYTLVFKKRGYTFSPPSITDTLDGPHRHYIHASK